MKLEEMKTMRTLSDFAKRCLQDDPTIEELWEKASDVKELCSLLQKDPRTRLSQATAVLIKENGQDDELDRYRRQILGGKCFVTTSDAGGVKLGNSDFSFIVRNQHGDGKTKCAILEKSEMNNCAFDFQMSVSGTFNIYSYDCGDEILMTLKGRYGVFVADGFVVFEKWWDEDCIIIKN